MYKYKTVVTDYEGMQGTLDAHSSQGWRLFSVTPDTYRKSVSSAGEGREVLPFEELDTRGLAQVEYSASYYLLVFVRDDPALLPLREAAAEQPLEIAGLSALEE